MAFYALETQQEGRIWDIQPTHVILYHPDILFVRQLEVCLSRWANSNQRLLEPVAFNALKVQQEGKIWDAQPTIMSLCHSDIPSSASSEQVHVPQALHSNKVMLQALSQHAEAQLRGSCCCMQEDELLSLCGPLTSACCCVDPPGGEPRAAAEDLHAQVPGQPGV